MLFLINVLIGELPDAIGLMAFGIVMVVTSMTLRRVIGVEGSEPKEKTIEEIV